MILNVSPMPDGTFPQRQKDIMTAFGAFLKQMGTAAVAAAVSRAMAGRVA